MKKARLVKILAVLGPGLIAANAGNDAGGIATYSQAGAAFGYRFLWAVLLAFLGVAIAQEMAVRMGAVTGKGLTDLIRENFGVRWTALAMVAFLIANGGTIVADFAGVGASLALFGVPPYLSVPVVALAIWYLVVRGSYRVVERVFLAMSLIFLGYIASAILAKPDWSAVCRGFVWPHLDANRDYLFMLVAIIGTTISPYMQLFAQSAVAEKNIDLEDYGYERLDVYAGSAFACLIACFIVIATGATLHQSGITQVESAADAARALGPLAGPYAQLLFAIGLFGASMLAAGVLPLSTTYAVSEAFGFERGISHSFEEAPFFMGFFTALTVIGAGITLIPGLHPIRVMILSQVIQGLLLPIILFFMLRLSNDRELMGAYANSRAFNVAAYAVAILCSILSLLMVATTLFEWVAG